MTTNKFSQLTPTGPVIEQFAYGKLIDGNRDLRGFTIVARSPGAPDENWTARIRAGADIGQVYDLANYAGSDVAFTLGDYIVAGRFQRSPKQYARGYFLQDHYLLLPKTMFAGLGNNYTYLLPLLPDAIPWRSQDENLPALPLPTRSQPAEAQRVQQIFTLYQEQVFQVLQLALDERPFIVMPTPDARQNVNGFLESLALLLPLSYRAELSWAINVMNVRQNKARVKVAFGSPTGAENYVTIRLRSARPTASQPLQPGSEATNSCLNTIRQYLDKFGLMALLQTIETLPVPAGGDWSELAFRMAGSLWYNCLPAMLESDLQAAASPGKEILNNILPVLDQPDFNVSPDQRSRFLAAIVGGALSGILPAQEASRLPNQVSQTNTRLLWTTLKQQFIEQIPENLDNTRSILAVWRKNGRFWQLSNVQKLVYDILNNEINHLPGQPEQALAHLRQAAVQQLIPTGVNYQAQLLKRVIDRAAPQSYRPESLLLTWLEMITNVSTALQVARDVPSLVNLLWHDSSNRYTYIINGFNRADAQKIDQMLAQVSPATLDQSAKLLLGLALTGERLELTCFRSAQLLYAVGRQTGQRPQEQVNRLIDILERNIAALNSDIQPALVGLMLAAGQTQRFKRLLAGDWHWIDMLIYWMGASPYLTPAYRSAIEVAIDWFKTPPPGLSPEERHERLKKVFVYWLQLTQNRLEAINDLTLLFLQDAFSGQGEAVELFQDPQQAHGLFQQFFQKLQSGLDFFQQRLGPEETELIKRVVTGLWFVHSNLFPVNSPLPPNVQPAYTAAYDQKLTEAFKSDWNRPDLTGKLITSLRKAGLGYETNWLRHININQRGPEILNNLSGALNGVFELTDLLYEAEEMTPDQIESILKDPVELKQFCQAVDQELGDLRKSLRRFQKKIR